VYLFLVFTAARRRPEDAEPLPKAHTCPKISHAKAWAAHKTRALSEFFIKFSYFTYSNRRNYNCKSYATRTPPQFSAWSPTPPRARWGRVEIASSAMDFPRFPPVSRVCRTYRFYTRCWWASRSTANLLFVSILLSRLTTSPVGGDHECRMIGDAMWHGCRAARMAARRAQKALRHAVRSSRHSGSALAEKRFPFGGANGTIEHVVNIQRAKIWKTIGFIK